MNNENQQQPLEEYDLNMAKYIWSILRTRPSITMSWGINPDSIKPVKVGLEFHVQGFIHTGIVRITLNEGEDLFEVELIDEKGEMVKKLTSIFFDELISVIDENVEKTEDYEKRICQEYPYLTKPVISDDVRPTTIVLL
jgi:hypothetical protein